MWIVKQKIMSFYCYPLFQNVSPRVNSFLNQNKSFKEQKYVQFIYSHPLIIIHISFEIITNLFIIGLNV